MQSVRNRLPIIHKNTIGYWHHCKWKWLLSPQTIRPILWLLHFSLRLMTLMSLTWTEKFSFSQRTFVWCFSWSGQKMSRDFCQHTVDFQDVFGSCTTVELVNVLSDDCDLTSLFAQSFLTFSNCHVGSVGIFREHELTAIVVKFPNPGRIPGKGLWGGKTLQG